MLSSWARVEVSDLWLRLLSLCLSLGLRFFNPIIEEMGQMMAEVPSSVRFREPQQAKFPFPVLRNLVPKLPWFFCSGLGQDPGRILSDPWPCSPLPSGSLCFLEGPPGGLSPHSPR